AATIQILIPQLLQQGYEFVTVDTLWQRAKANH
ncbi:MAG: polysaccharide deacetylase family protein, partial [Nostoc sp.]